MGSFKKFSQNKLPNRCKFFRSLKDKCISEKDYLKADNMWNLFKINTMRDYHDHYLKTECFIISRCV